MTLFRKKPVVIEARQFNNNNEPYQIDALVQWMRGFPGCYYHDHTSIFIETLEGVIRADLGDWIIKGVKNEFYPCKPDIFALTYEPVDSTVEKFGGVG